MLHSIFRNSDDGLTTNRSELYFSGVTEYPLDWKS